MTKPTKQQIDGATPEQLAEWVAVHCMGWDIAKSGFYYNHSAPILKIKDWQPHLPIEQGKAQAIDLAEKYALVVYPQSPAVFIPGVPEVILGDTWQTAVLRACLYSVIGEQE